MVEKDIFQELEKINEEIALKVAIEGIVLLENNGALPLTSKTIALYGSGARQTSKGGTGSGDVNNRRNINIEEGLEISGSKITTKKWLDDCDSQLLHEQEIRNQKLQEIGKKYSVFKYWDLMNALAIPIVYPKGREITIDDVTNSQTDTAIYVLTRQAGEGLDRRNIKGDYYPTDKEVNDLKFLVDHYKKVILVINVGACIDMEELLAVKPSAVIFMGQAGQIGGLAVAKLMSGEYNFSGKLAATWPKKLRDIPCSDSYSFLDGNTDKENYKEGIYVGYRYFDSFGIEPRYAFGYGVSYTNFNIDAKESLYKKLVFIKAKVQNIGNYIGKEVVQVYISCPSGVLKREYQQLATFAKTSNIAIGESQELDMSFDLTDFAAYDEEKAHFVLEKGNYIIKVGQQFT